MLEHFADVRGVLGLAARALRPDGWLLITEMHADLADAGTGAHFEADGLCHVLPSPRHTADELAAVLHETGFVIERVLELRASDHVDAIPKLARHGTRHALYACLARCSAHVPCFAW